MSDSAVPQPPDFDDRLYLELNQDVAAAVASGVYESGFAHYAAYGASEGRRYRPAPPMPAYAVERLRLSPGGGLFLAGWLDDSADALAELSVEGEGWSVALTRLALARQRRRDVEATLGAGARHAYGFWSLVDLGHALPGPRTCRVVLHMQGGGSATLEVAAEGIADADLRELALAHLAHGDFFGDPHHSGIASLDGGVAEQIIALNRRVSAAMADDPYVERFGAARARLHGSIVVCLFGHPEYLFLQNTLFASAAGFEGYELIYVCNSPDLAERLLRDARIATLVHGTRQTLVLLSGNAGFGVANNVAVGYASSDRVLLVNPDVFPRHADWPQRHAALVDSLPAAQTELFGATLYYGDGSLMHGGLYFEADAVPVATAAGLRRRDLLRVEHYGKGAPPDTARFIQARPVPAVSGAFISCRRGWFESLGGFSPDFVFGHYEDADLCLRSLSHGVPAWLHDLPLWHLEGKGSPRQPAHEGGALVNRWLFSRRWSAELANGLLGATPTHPALAASPTLRPVPPRRARTALAR